MMTTPTKPANAKWGWKHAIAFFDSTENIAHPERLTLKQFNAAVEATDLLIHRRRLRDLHDMFAATQYASKDFAKYVSAVTKARKRG